MKKIYFLACALLSVVCVHVVAAPATETFSIAANQADADKTGTVPHSQGPSEQADKANPQATPPGSKPGDLSGSKGKNDAKGNSADTTSSQGPPKGDKDSGNGASDSGSN
jgi:hypothetical protein